MRGPLIGRASPPGGGPSGGAALGGARSSMAFFVLGATGRGGAPILGPRCPAVAGTPCKGSRSCGVVTPGPLTPLGIVTWSPGARAPAASIWRVSRGSRRAGARGVGCISCAIGVAPVGRRYTAQEVDTLEGVARALTSRPERAATSMRGVIIPLGPASMRFLRRAGRAFIAVVTPAGRGFEPKVRRGSLTRGVGLATLPLGMRPGGRLVATARRPSLTGGVVIRTPTLAAQRSARRGRKSREGNENHGENPTVEARAFRP